MACEFCQEFQGTQFPLRDELAAYGIEDRTVVRGRRARAFAGLGPISLGYALVSPVAHVTCLADVDAETLLEIEHQRRQISQALRATYGSATCFEHGSRLEGRSGACYDHAHLHVIGGQPDLRSAAREVGREFPFDRLTQLPSICAGASDYLLLGTDDGQFYAYEVCAELPSQFFRQRWAREVPGATSYDWGVTPNYKLLSDTVEFFQKHLSQERAEASDCNGRSARPGQRPSLRPRQGNDRASANI
jgi:diadenosine tetraphosphate (Ap4A) HIT family hydrolase